MIHYCSSWPLLAGLSICAGLSSASAQVQSSCAFETSVEQSWADAALTARANMRGKNSMDASKTKVAVAILAWGQRGISGAGNPGGIVPSKDNKLLDDAMACYVMEAICGMPRKGQMFKKYRKVKTTGRWTPDSGIPQYAPVTMVRWAEKHLECRPDMPPINFSAAEPPAPPKLPAPQPPVKAKPALPQAMKTQTKPANEAEKPKQSFDEYLKQYRLNNFTQSCDKGIAESCWALGWEHVKYHKYARGSSRFKAQMKKACDLGHAQACKDMRDTVRTAPAKNKLPSNHVVNYAAMEAAPLSDACWQASQFKACTELYRRERGQQSKSYQIAEHICDYWGRGQYCFEAGADLLFGNGKTPLSQGRAYDNFHRGCYQRHAKSCYQGGNIKLSGARGRKDFYDAMMLFDISCNLGYRDSCALKRSAQRGGDNAVAQANRRLRENHDDALRCKTKRIVGHGGRIYNTYECRTNREWKKY